MLKITALPIVGIAFSSLFVTGWLLAQDGPPSVPTKKATPEEMKALASRGKIDGVVGGISGSSISVIIPDDRQYKALMAKASRLQGQAREDAMKQINMIPRGKEYEIELSEKCSLRKANASTGLEFDSKGNPKVYTAAEKAKMKGTGPGWTATPEDIAPGLGVTVTIARDKKDSNKPLATMVYVNNIVKKQ